MEFITLIDQVRKEIGLGNIPVSDYVPRMTMISIPMRFGRGVKIVPRRTMGFWAGFAHEVDKPTNPNQPSTYYFSMDGEFAVSAFHSGHRVLEPLSILEVLSHEDMWQEGFEAMLDPSEQRMQGLSLNPM